MPDIILLGATGFNGRLIARYLASHPQRGRFSWAVAARSKNKLDQLVEGLSLPSDVGVLEFNADDKNNVEEVVKSARVIINAVGPFALHGTPVVRACVRNAVNYVDLTGEVAWVHDIIKEFDYAAVQKGAIIVPCCGMDSVPSDLTAYLANKTLKAALEQAGHIDFTGKGSSIAESLTAYQRASRLSGGTIHTALSLFDGDMEKFIHSSRPYALSPVPGIPTPMFQTWYNLRIPGEKPLTGGYFVMRGINAAIVQRTFGLLEARAEVDELKQGALASHVMTPTRKQRYGPMFKYDEFLVTNSTWQALVLSYGLALGALLLAYVKPIRMLARKLVPSPGEGPSDEEMEKGYLIGTNLTTSATNPPIHVKTSIIIRGSPGNLRTATMISESALSLLLPPVSANSEETTATYSARSHLSPMGQRGGVLTPVTAFGDILMQRLIDSGSFEFSSHVVGKEDAVLCSV
ncbi:Saccharopine dehydrogenase domain containing protein [Amanita muscaria]